MRNWARAKREVDFAREVSDRRVHRKLRSRHSDEVTLQLTWPNGNSHELAYTGTRTPRAVREWLKKFPQQPLTVTVFVNGRRKVSFPAVKSDRDLTQAPGIPQGADTTKSPLSNRDLGAQRRMPESPRG